MQCKGSVVSQPIPAHPSLLEIGIRAFFYNTVLLQGRLKSARSHPTPMLVLG